MARRKKHTRTRAPKRHRFTREECRRGYQAALIACVKAGWERYAWFFRHVRGYYRHRRPAS
jgi:hypothetical protein